MCRDRELGISVILLIVDLRVVDILGIDVILDMDELTAIGLSVIVTLAGLSYPTWSWSWVRLHMHVVGCVDFLGVSHPPLLKRISSRNSTHIRIQPRTYARGWMRRFSRGFTSSPP